MPLDVISKSIDAIIDKVGKKIVLGTPLGIGKPNILINEIYNRAKTDSTIQLTILSALTLTKPDGTSDLEKRFFRPFSQRVFGDYPNLDYDLDRQNNTIPSNIKVIEFYYPAGKLSHSSYAQKNYLSSNYTHAARDIIGRGINVLVQQVSSKIIDGELKYSLSSNPDLSLDIVQLLKKKNYPWTYVAQVNNNLPFMLGDALVDGDTFDQIIDVKEGHYKLFGPPKMPVSDVDYAIGIYASSLIKDDGELQVGIGSLGDALVYHLGLRQENNSVYKKMLDKFNVLTHYPQLIEDFGEIDLFKKGLFGASEMVVDGFMHLYKKGILKKKVYDHIGLQRLINEGILGPSIPENILEILVKKNIVNNPMTFKDFKFLQKVGILKDSTHLKYNNENLILDDGRQFFADLNDPEFFAHQKHVLGDKLIGGNIVHGGFFLGPTDFYHFFNVLPEDELKLFNMRSVTKINQLYGHEEIDRLHRKNARFINTCLKVLMSGAAASDALEDGTIVSGVGGQYNFVAMAHELEGGRSILLLKSTHQGKNGIESNIVWNYGHCTIPKHLRDIVITEYGIADLRGKTDEEIIIELLNITDSRFQKELLNKAKKFNKLSKDYQIPMRFKNNLPETISNNMDFLKKKGICPPFPFGTDFTPEELKIAKALKRLKKLKNSKGKLLLTILKILIKAPLIKKEDDLLLKRMDYHKKLTWSQNLYKNLLIDSLHK